MIIKPEISSPIKSKIPSKQGNYVSPVYDSYCVQAKTYFGGYSIEGNYKKAINDFIKGCIIDNNWDEIEIMYLLANPDFTLAKTNLKNPNQYTLTQNGTITFTKNKGTQGDGSTGYFNTNYSPSGKFTQNNASAGIYSYTEAALTNTNDFGSNSATPGLLMINPRNLGNAFSARLNSATGGSFANSTSVGYFGLTRTDASNLKLIKNGSTLSTITNSSSSLSAFNFYIHATNNIGTASSFSTRQLGFVFVGSGNVDHSKLYTRLNTYLSAIGAI